MPEPQPHLDDQQTDKTFPALEKEVTLEAEDKCIQASIMILPGNTFACRTVDSSKHDAEVKSLGEPMIIPFRLLDL